MRLGLGCSRARWSLYTDVEESTHVYIYTYIKSVCVDVCARVCIYQLCRYIHICAYMYVHSFICTYKIHMYMTGIYVCIHICMCICAYMYICMNVYMYIRTCVYMYVSTYVYMYLYEYACVYA